ncbi:protein sneaky-like [Epargyreus clarus]|uniref:protein sneaky-like n=1 Tax=Epargyreus clarus TaxID=520877 RepID=UPI003C2D6306
MFLEYKCRWLKSVLAFAAGFALGHLYYIYLLRDIPFPYHMRFYGWLVLSLLLGIGNVISIQLRCTSLLLLPMYCGKPGRGVLKAVVLIYVIAGPVTNMGLNAKEVVRVFACSAELSYNLTKTKYSMVAGPLKIALFGLKSEIAELKDTFRSIQKVTGPIQHEIEDFTEQEKIRIENDHIDAMLGNSYRSNVIDKKYSSRTSDKKELLHQNKYLKKTEYRCEHQMSQGVYNCLKACTLLYNVCCYVRSEDPAAFCQPLRLPYVCNLSYLEDNFTCNSLRQVDPGLGEGYAFLKRIKNEFTRNPNCIKMQNKISYVQDLYDNQDAKETGKLVMHAFKEKNMIMQSVITVVNICLALIFFRIVFAAQNYHDLYLTNIEFDNVYVTSRFKRIDLKRKKRDKNSLLPLKKMERNKYVDVHSMSYIPSERSNLLTQMLKVMLEVVTATTFVMLDRLFFEALDVVRQHAGQESQQEMGDLKIEVEGTGSLADMVRKVLDGLRNPRMIKRVTNVCLPRPRAMPTIYYFKIYGGYLWILLLLYLNPYTLRLRRLICSYFYPNREKQRILHLYNDILKKRLKMQKTLRRKAVRTVRAHYLSGENLLSLRIRYPQVLGWLAILPMARMQCMICGDTEPRNGPSYLEGWYSCTSSKCPFVYCAECWREAGGRCLACDPRLAQLSDVDSITDDEPPRY